jgi:hypothetical protein
MKFGIFSVIAGCLALLAMATNESHHTFCGHEEETA